METLFGFYQAQIKDPETLSQVEALSIDMGHFFSVQDDYLDVYGDPAVMGKTGTDIVDGKCSWVVVTALQNATPAEHEIIIVSQNTCN